MPATIRKVVTVSLAKNRRRLRRELASAEKELHDSGGVLWERHDRAKREMQTVNIMIEEWKNDK